MDAVYKYTSDLLREVSSVVVAAVVAVIFTPAHTYSHWRMSLPLTFCTRVAAHAQASLRQADGLARGVIAAEGSRRVTLENFFTFVPPAKRPWIEHVFRRYHSTEFNRTAVLPPRAAETGTGLFH